jgi:hypothetical protein
MLDQNLAFLLLRLYIKRHLSPFPATIRLDLLPSPSNHGLAAPTQLEHGLQAADSLSFRSGSARLNSA